MEEIVKQRVIDFISSTGLSVLAFSKTIGVPQTTLNQQLKGRSDRKNTQISISVVALILESYPMLSAEWLLRGKEPMMVEPSNSSTGLPAEERRILLRQIDNLNDQVAELKAHIIELKKEDTDLAV